MKLIARAGRWKEIEKKKNGDPWLKEHGKFIAIRVLFLAFSENGFLHLCKIESN